MITLRADNRVLVNNAKFSYLVQNYQPNVPSMEVTNSEPFAVGDPILISEMGQSDAEVLKIHDISSGVITLGDVNNVVVNTIHSHPESTRVTVLQFDQIQFYWTPATGTIADEAPVFNDLIPLTGWVPLDPSSYYSTFADTGHASGFGWFMYKNALTGETSMPSNAIPYAGFTMNTVSQVFSDFDSLLNTNELKLVSISDKFSWLNEALAVLKNKLNLTNAEFTVSVPQTITTVVGTEEYMLPDDFSDVVEITTAINGRTVEFIPVSKIMANNGTMPTVSRYYLRGRYIGFSPIPTEATTYNYTYRTKSTRVTSLSAYIDLPDNAFYSLKDWMMYRAYMKFNNPLATAYYQSFKNSVDLFMQSAVKRSANLDSWEMGAGTNA